MNHPMTTLSGPIRLRVKLVYPEIAILGVCLFLATIWRGLDYITPPTEDHTKALTVVEQTMPMSAWGVLMLTAGVAGLLGLRWVRWPLTALAHGGAMALYSAFAVGSILSILDRVHRLPTALELSYSGAAIVGALIVLAFTERYMVEWRSAAWVLLGGTVMAVIISLAAAVGVYGYRTATDWIFVFAVAHAVMADAAFDAWRDERASKGGVNSEEATDADTA